MADYLRGFAKGASYVLCGVFLAAVLGSAISAQAGGPDIRPGTADMLGVALITGALLIMLMPLRR